MFELLLWFVLCFYRSISAFSAISLVLVFLCFWGLITKPGAMDNPPHPWCGNNYWGQDLGSGWLQN